ncbi:MAG: tandem-95 repeat protein, partial [Gammaproteobacteria bacterium]|nr:tandem-95 repeat protein [Gammaproteobacteria bacterium]
SSWVMADGVRIEQVTGDFGQDDDVHLAAGSAAIDRGDPLAKHQIEPVANGNRLDLGAYGNTPEATASPNPQIQVLGPNGLEKVEVGTPITVSVMSAGLLPYDTVMLLNAGTGGAVDNWLAPQYRTDQWTGYYTTIAAATAIDLSTAGANAAPGDVYRTIAYVPGGVGYALNYDIPLADGSYQVVLHFIEPSNIGVGQRLFDVAMNGTTLQSNLDVRALAGGVNKALALTYSATVSGGQGLDLVLKNVTTSYTAMISGIEIRRLNTQGVANPIVNLELSTDNGLSWTTVVTGVTLDRYGRGQAQWTPTTETVGNTALIRAVATINPPSGAITVSDVSDEAFLIANGGHTFYVNDGSTIGDEYTTALGNNLNSGKDPNHPVASLATLLRAYDLDPGDVVYVDTGSFRAVTNIRLAGTDTGVVIQGAQQPGHTTLINRGNTNTGAYVFEFQGADNVTMANLSITGGAYGVVAANTADSDNVTIRNSEVFGNGAWGFSIDTSNDYFTLDDVGVHGNPNGGAWLRGAGDVVKNSEIYGNGGWGLDTAGNDPARPIVVTASSIHDNANGVTASSYVQITNNEVFNHLTSSRIGIQVSSGAVAKNNVVHNNATGIYATYSALAQSNEVFANGTGISIYSASVSSNRVYSNSTGIADTGYSQVENNAVYANTNVGIALSGYHNGQSVRDNTIYQLVGDAVTIAASTQDAQLYNNIVKVNAGYGISTGTGVLRLLADYNLFSTPLAGAKVGLWNNATQAAEIADWRTLSAQDAHSKEGDPLFLDPDGADNVLGEKGLVTGNGFDDNFGLRANSAAIDSANMYYATATDIQGMPRRDDPSTANTGDGLPLYVPTSQATSFNGSAGTKWNFRQYDYGFSYTLPFSFTLYGKSYTSVVVNSNGFLQFEGPDSAYGTNNANSLDKLVRNVRIAPLWDDLATYSPTDATRDVYVDSATAGQVTFRWAAIVEGTNNPVNFSVTLFADGRFRFDYGPSATGLTPTVGVSAGNGQTYVLAPYDGRSDLSLADSLMWNTAPGLTYYDVGAYEFLGDSNDHTAPQVVNVSQLPANGGTTAAAFSSLQIDFSETLDGISARSPANYDLLAAGADGLFGTPDDTHIALKPGYSFPETNLTLQLVNGVLAEGTYRLTLSGTLGIFDTAGNLLDGNADGTGGDDYVREFTIDRTGNTPPVATDAVAAANEDGSVQITLAGTDPNGDPLTYSLVTNPQHGTLTNFDPVAHTVIYVPDANFNGTDSFKFRVDDGNLGTDDGTILVNVLPVNDAPTAAGTMAATDEDTAVDILLPGADLETTRQQLTFSLGTAPLHGALIQGPNGLWTYVPDANYNGSDSFTYVVTDRGDPDGALGNALSSTPGSVFITVRPINDAPVVPPIAARNVSEGQTLSFTIPADDPDGNTLSYSLVNNTVAGAGIDATTGVFTWKPADGADTKTFTVRVSDGTLTTDASFDVVVANVAPTITVTGLAAINLGESYAVNWSATDPGTDTIIGWRVNWGDGATTNVGAAVGTSSHAYTQGGHFSVTVTATDEDGSFDSAPLAMQVIAPNRAPVAPGGQSATLNEDGSITLSLLYGDPDGDPLALAITQAPAHGALSAFDPATHKITYAPAGNFNGADSFQFTVTDTSGATASAAVALTVKPVNDAPTANAQSGLSVVAGQPLNGTLSGSDVETPAAALVHALATGPAHGTVTVDANGTFTYTAALNYVGTDTFTFTTTDNGDPAGSGTGLTSAPATVTIDVLPSNHAPVASSDSYVVHAGTKLTVSAANGVLANDTDPDGDPLTVDFAQTAGLHGTLVMNTDGSFEFTPAAGFTGTTSFVYQASDGRGGISGATVNIDVQNAAPVVTGDHYVVHTNGTLTVDAAHGLLANDSDPDGDAFVAIASAPAPEGTLSLATDGSFQFVPTAGFTGQTSFQYRAIDSNGAETLGMVTIDVTNGTPVANTDHYAVQGGQTLTITAPGLLANDTDPEGDALTIIAVDNATSNSVSWTADGGFDFTAAPGVHGTSSFTYTITDGNGGQAVGTVTIDVLDNAPVANADHYTAHTGQALHVAGPGVLGNDTDADGDALTVQSANVAGLQGALVIQPDGSFDFTPNPGFTGQTSFTYVAADGFGAQSEGTVTIDVANAAPVAGTDTFAIHAGQALHVAAPGLLANDTDADGDALTIGTVSYPSPQGALVVMPDGSFDFTPNAGFTGQTGFTYQLLDGLGGQTTGTVVISVGNSTPVANADHYTMRENASLVIPAPGLLANDTDADGDALTVQSISYPTPQGAIVSMPDGSLKFTPNADFTGTTSFEYTLTDGNGAQATATVTIDVVNSAPVAGADHYTMHTGQTLAIAAPGLLANDTDADGDTLTFGAISYPSPQGALAVMPDGSFTFTPNPGYTGTTSFEYQLLDGYGGQTQGTVTIDVTNAVPVANADHYTVNAGQTLTIAAPGVLGNDTDPDGDTLTLQTVSYPAQQGALVVMPDGSVTFTPQAGFTGQTSFEYTLADGNGAQATGTVTIDVTGTANAAPTANADSYTVHPGRTLTIAAPGLLANDTDADGNALTLSGVDTTGLQGALAANADGSFTFTPNAGYTGTTGFEYTIDDGHGGGATGNVTIFVGNTAPNAVNDVYNVHRGQTLTVPAASGLLANDTDADGDTLRIVAINPIGLQGTVHATPNGGFTFTLAAGFVGTTSFKYTEIDGFGGFRTATATIEVTNGAPIAADDHYTVTTGHALSVALPGVLGNDTDPDGDALQAVAFDTTGLQGALTTAADGHFVFTPAAGFVGTTSFKYTIADGLGGTGGATATIDVLPPTTLYVTAFAQTNTGVALRFSKPLDAAQLNLYSGAATTLGAADLVLTGPGGKAVQGSVVLDADLQGLTFLRTGGVLAAGGYTLTLAARADGFASVSAGVLDGDMNDVAGADYVRTFTVPAASGPLVSLGELARGPGQTLTNPLTGTGLAVALDGVAGATHVQFTVHYDATALGVTGLDGAALPVGTTVNVDTSTPGLATFDLSFSAPLPAGCLALGNLAGTIPVDALYGIKSVLKISDVIVDGNAVAARADDGLLVVAFIGDTSGDASYTTLDVQRLQRVMQGTDTGFGAWPLVDPVIIGDVKPNGALQLIDSLLVARQVAGLPVSDIEPIPAGLPPLQFYGWDPLVALGTVTATAGGTASLPVTIDTAAGLESVQIKVSYDATALAVTGVANTALTQDFTYKVVKSAPGELVIDATATKPVAAGTGDLFLINFAVAPGATGRLAIDLVSARLNDSWLTLNPAPVAGLDPTDGTIDVLQPKKASLALNRQAKGFALGKTAQSAWLDTWVSQKETRPAKTNNWSVSAAGRNSTTIR